MRLAVVGYPVLSKRQWLLCSEFEEIGVETHIIVPEYWEEIPESDEPDENAPFTVHRLNPIFNGKSGVYLLRNLSDALRDIDPDAVITHGEPWELITLATGHNCRKLDLKHVGFSWENLERIPQSLPKRQLERVGFRQIDGAIAGSEAANRRLRNRGFKGPTITAPQTGVDTEMFSPDLDGKAVRSKFGIEPDSDVVLYAGRLSHEKGINILLDAIPRILSSEPQTEFLILGTGPLTQNLSEMISNLSRSDQVNLITDRQPYSLMPNIYNAADVFVYPSITVPEWAEQFGYAAAEAMSCSVPVVTTECGALPYVVGEGGLVCPERDAGALAQQTLKLLSNKEYRKKVAVAARDRVDSQFSLRQVAEDHLSIVERLSR